MRSLRLLTLLLVGLRAWGLAAQQPTPDANAAPYILHVYANLVQVPALILNQDYEPLRSLTKDSIEIRLDSGPPFHPVKMHIEGDEPISLTLLLDASGTQKEWMRSIRPAITTLVNHSLKAQDRVSIFAFDCKLVRFPGELPANVLVLTHAIDAVLATPGLHNGKAKPACSNSAPLWDDIARTLELMQGQSGRRVLLVVSSGEDHKSRNNWNEVRQYAAIESIAIFGVRDLTHMSAGLTTPLSAMFSGGVYNASGTREGDPFMYLCTGTGGLVLTTAGFEFPGSLARIIDMVRARYILEFPRPDASTPGEHQVDVAVPSQHVFITTSGVTVPLPDAAIRKDPTTIPSSPSPAVMGKRRILNPSDH